MWTNWLLAGKSNYTFSQSGPHPRKSVTPFVIAEKRKAALLSTIIERTKDIYINTLGIF